MGMLVLVGVVVVLLAEGGVVDVLGRAETVLSRGKVVETWTEWDNLGLARQLGAAPREGSIGEKIGTKLQRLTARRRRKQDPI